MSLSAALILAAAAPSVVSASAQPASGVELAEARVTVRILTAAVVRQASGPEPVGDQQPYHQLSRRGRTVLVEYQ